MGNIFTQGLTFLAGIILLSGQARAEDRDGWLINIGRTTVAREDGRTGDYTQEVDRQLALRMVLKNISMKDREAGTVEYAILVKRWDGEAGKIQRYSGKLDLQAVKRGETVDLNTAEFHIGGHLHGTSRIHCDEMEAWKVTVTAGNKATVFRSSGKFDMLDKRATAAR